MCYWYKSTKTDWAEKFFFIPALELGLAVDTPNARGRTALHDAAAMGQTNTAAALLAANASVARKYADVC